MEKRIVISEKEPISSCLWLHTKDGYRVIEEFGPKGWAPITSSRSMEVLAEISALALSGNVNDLTINRVISSESNVSLMIKGGTDYILGEIESLEIVSVEDSPHASFIYFSSGDSVATTIIFPTMNWIGETLLPETGKSYVIGILNGIGIMSEVASIPSNAE